MRNVQKGTKFTKLGEKIEVGFLFIKVQKIQRKNGKMQNIQTL